MKKHYQFIVIGAGPAGVQLGYYLQKYKADYLILEKAKRPGAFFEKFPIHRKLLSINKPYTGFKDPEKNMRWDWNSLLSDDHGLQFTDYTDEYFPDADLLVKYIRDYAKKYQLNIKTGTTVKCIEKNGERFTLTLENGAVFTSDALVVATGLSKSYTPDIPGIQYCTDYTELDLDKSKYKNKRVLIIGKGNSSFETADHLINVTALTHIASPSPLKFAWKTHFVGHLRAINNNFLDTYQLKALNAVINADITRIKKKGKQFLVTFNYHLASGEVETIKYDHVIVATGFRMDTDIFAKNTKPKMIIHDRLPKLDANYESTNIKNLFFAGTLMQSRDFKKEQSSFIHGFRYNVKFLAQYLYSQLMKKQFPVTRINNTVESISKKIIRQVNRSSTLWQQTRYLCDVIELNPDARKIRHFEGIPIDFATKKMQWINHHYLVITLEFGQEIINRHPDVFKIKRIKNTDYDNAHLSTFIHPVIRLYQNDKQIDEHHIIEDLAIDWREPEHTEPLKQWLNRVVSGARS